MNTNVAMSTQTRIPISVRITQEDADFIAALEIEGANTPSEKIRALLAQARLEHEQEIGFETSLQQAQAMISPAKRDVAKWEKNHAEHSALIARSFEILPDLMAFLATEGPDEDTSLNALRRYEAGIAARVMHLIESILQLTVTGSSPCYDDLVLMKQLDTTLALAKIVLQQKQATSEKEAGHE